LPVLESLALSCPGLEKLVQSGYLPLNALTLAPNTAIDQAKSLLQTIKSLNAWLVFLFYDCFGKVGGAMLQIVQVLLLLESG
jgi:hypothetical protein